MSSSARNVATVSPAAAGMDYKNFIGGRFVAAPPNQRRITVTNPVTNEALGTVPESSFEDLDAAFAAAEAAQENWAERPSTERAGFLHALAGKIRECQE